MDNKLYKKLFDSNVEILMELTGCTRDEIMRSKKEDCLECRCLLINIAIDYKVSFAQIKQFSGFSIQAIEREYARREERMKKFDVRIAWEIIKANTAAKIADYQH